MKSKQILFFATREDIYSIVSYLESEFSIKYIQMGLFNENKSQEYNSIDEVQDFGTPQFGDWNKDMRIMMVPQGINIVIRKVPQKNGETKYAIDPLENQMSICFQFGGIVKEGVLLAGSCGASFLNDFSPPWFVSARTTER